MATEKKQYTDNELMAFISSSLKFGLREICEELRKIREAIELKNERGDNNVPF